MEYTEMETVNVKQEVDESALEYTEDDPFDTNDISNYISENIFIKTEALDNCIFLDDNFKKPKEEVGHEKLYQDISSTIKNKNLYNETKKTTDDGNERKNSNVEKKIKWTKENYAVTSNKESGNIKMRRTKKGTNINDLLLKKMAVLQSEIHKNKGLDIDAHFNVNSNEIKPEIIEFSNNTNFQHVVQVEKTELITPEEIEYNINESSTYMLSSALFYCDMCNYKTNIKTRLKSHMLFHRDKNKYTNDFFNENQTMTKKIFPCKYCTQIFAHRKDLSAHKKSHSGEKRFACNFCDQKFRYKSIMERHSTTHTGLKPFPCDVCNRKFTDRTALDRHMLTHTGEKPFSCSVCPNRFARKSNLLRHIKTHTGEKPFKCNICGNLFSQKGNLLKHVRTHTGEKPFSCTICGNKFSQKSNLMNHLKSSTGQYPKCMQQKLPKRIILPSDKPFSCNICDRKFVYKSTLMRHKKKTHNDNSSNINCLDNVKKDACGKYYTSLTVKRLNSKDDISEVSDSEAQIENPINEKTINGFCHVTVAKGTYLDEDINDDHIINTMKNCDSVTSKILSGEKPFTCDLCPSKFRQKHHLQRHIKTHTGEKSWSCDLCDFKCAESYSLVKHMRTHTGEKPYACNFCEYRCTSSSHLTEHIRTHTGEKPYSCKICDYRGASSSNLAEHIRIHSGEKPHECNICHNRFTLRSNLAKHLRTHTGEKPFSCTFCLYRCSNPSALVRHVRTHTGEKPFRCDLCLRKFTQKCHLDIHLRTHNGNKPFYCGVCKQKFAQKSNLLKHIKSHIQI